MTSRRKLLAQAHIAAEQLGLDDELRRDIIERVTGQRSCAGLSERALISLLDEFRRMGWQSAPPQERRAKNPQARMVWGIWSEMCALGIPREPTRAALRTFCKRLTGVEEPDWMTVPQVSKVIESLKQWRDRERKEKASGN